MNNALQKPNLGHNNPPVDTNELNEYLKTEHAPILDDARNLIQRAQEMVKDNPAISDDELSGKFSDMIKEITATTKKIETTRVGEKEPFLAGGRTVDSFFKRVTDTLDKTKRAMNMPLTGYLTEKQNAERRRIAAEAEEKRKLAEAQLNNAVALDEAGMGKAADNTMAKADANTQAAVKLEGQVQAATPAELSRTRGESSLASLRTEWKGRIVDVDRLDLEKLRHLIGIEALQKAVNAYVKAGNRELNGAIISEESTATTR